MTESPLYLGRPIVRSTTVLGVRRDGALALAGDGQVTSGDVVLKHGARKVRTLYDGQVLAGFAGAVADALTLFAKFEQQLKAWDGNLRRAAVELTKEWRSDRYLRRLEAQLLVGDAGSLLILSGEGDVIEPDDGIAAIGSGSAYATAAAKALLSHTDLTATAIVEAAMIIAADICIYTNNHFSIETVAGGPEVDEGQPEELPLDGYLPPVDNPSTEDELDDDDDEDDERDELIEDEDDDEAEER